MVRYVSPASRIAREPCQQSVHRAALARPRRARPISSLGERRSVLAAYPNAKGRREWPARWCGRSARGIGASFGAKYVEEYREKSPSSCNCYSSSARSRSTLSLKSRTACRRARMSAIASSNARRPSAFCSSVGSRQFGDARICSAVRSISASAMNERFFSEALSSGYNGAASRFRNKSGNSYNDRRVRGASSAFG
jgi:hypothetical protein